MSHSHPSPSPDAMPLSGVPPFVATCALALLLPLLVSGGGVAAATCSADYTILNNTGGCHNYPNLQANITTQAGCCAACTANAPCTTWCFHAVTKQCFHTPFMSITSESPEIVTGVRLAPAPPTPPPPPPTTPLKPHIIMLLVRPRCSDAPRRRDCTSRRFPPSPRWPDP